MDRVQSTNFAQLRNLQSIKLITCLCVGNNFVRAFLAPAVSIPRHSTGRSEGEWERGKEEERE